MYIRTPTILRYIPFQSDSSTYVLPFLLLFLHHSVPAHGSFATTTAHACLPTCVPWDRAGFVLMHTNTPVLLFSFSTFLVSFTVHVTTPGISFLPATLLLVYTPTIPQHYYFCRFHCGPIPPTTPAGFYRSFYLLLHFFYTCYYYLPASFYTPLLIPFLHLCIF